MDQSSPQFARVDEICDQFESAWKSGQQPSLEAFLGQVAAESREALLQELLTVECECLLEQGKRPSFRAYRRRFPEQQEIVRQVFADLDLLNLSSSNSETAPTRDTTTSVKRDDTQATPPATPADGDRVVDSVLKCGLVGREELKGIVDALPAEERTPQGMMAALIRQKKASRFQAQKILSGQANELQLGAYLLVAELGQGGMGKVYKAVHRKMGREVALKVLSAGAFADAEALHRFEREISAVSKLNHPNIVTAYDANEAEGIHFLVMEYVPGIDLDALVMRDGPLTADAAVSYILQAAEGLAHAHHMGIIHRDIKPANLLLSAQGTVKVLDMGLARIGADQDKDQKITATGQILGTSCFMAPEQALKIKTADERVDIYSLGCSLYFLLSGDPPYEADTALGTLYAHQEDPIPSLLALPQPVPQWLQQVYQRMMAKTAEDRYPTMAALISDLRQGAANGLAAGPTGPQVMGSPLPSSPPVQASPSSNASIFSGGQGVWIGAGISALVLVPVLLVLAISSLSPDDEVIAAADVKETAPSANKLVPGEDSQPASIQPVATVPGGTQPDETKPEPTRSPFPFDNPTPLPKKEPPPFPLPDPPPKGFPPPPGGGRPPPRGEEPQRPVAEWILSRGGELTIDLPEGLTLIDEAKKLPARPFGIRDVDLAGKAVTDGDLKRFEPVITLRKLNLASTKVTDRGLSYLSRLRQLQEINVSDTDVSAAGARELKRKLPRVIINR